MSTETEPLLPVFKGYEEQHTAHEAGVDETITSMARALKRQLTKTTMDSDIVVHRGLFLHAIVLIESALDGRPPPAKTDPASLRNARTYFSYSRQYLRRIMAALWLAVAFIENPQTFECSIWISRCTQAACFMFFAFDISSRVRFVGARGTISTTRNGYIILILLVLLFESLLEGFGYSHFRLLRMFRPFLLINTSHTLARAMNVVGKTVIRILPVSLLLLLTVGLFGLVAMTMFLGTGKEINNFGTVHDSIKSMMILTTTANNPDVWMEAYNADRAYAIFFITFTSLTVYIITNIILATVYNEWKDQFKEDTIATIERRRSTLKEAFPLMCGSFSKNPSSASLTLTFEEMREVFRACGLKGKSIPALFLLMDKSHSGHITASEFLSLFDLLALNLEVVQSEQATPMAKRYPHLRKMVHAGWFLILTDIVIFCSAFIIIRELIVEGKFQQSTFSRFLDISFLTFSMIEVGLRLLIGGLHTPRDVWLKFDSVVVVTMCLAELFMVFEQISFVRLTIILRVMRLVRPMSMLPEFRVVTRTLASIVPRIGVVAAILMTAFYVYGQLGMFLYHGTIVKDDPRLEGSDFAKNNYWLLNFDDFYNTLVTLYCVMLTNNWFVIMNAYATVTSEWATVYFTVWVLFTMQVALNLLIGFVVDTYQYENERVKNSPTFEVFMTKEGSPSHIRRVYEERTSEEVKKLEAEMEENGESYFSISLKSFMTGDDWLRDMFMRDVFQVLDPDDWEAAKFSNLRSHASADNRTTRHSHTDVLSGTDGGPSENDPQVDASVVRRVNSESTIV